MSPSRRKPSYKRKQQPPTTVEAPVLDECTYVIAEHLSPEFDPNRVLLRRTFFINSDKSKYVSVGFYPTKNYTPLVEFGGAKLTPITLMKQHVDTLFAHLDKLYGELCNSGRYVVQDDAFKITTTGTTKVAKLTIHTQTINLKLHEVRYLMGMFHIMRDQLDLFLHAQTDLMMYVTNALSSVVYVQPTSNLTHILNFAQLFEELKAVT